MNETTHLKIRLLTLVVVGIVSLVAMVWFVNKYLLRSRAAGTNSAIELPSVMAGNVNEQIDVPITINSDGAEVIAADVVVAFDRAFLEVVDIAIDPLISNTFTMFPLDGAGNFNKAQVIQTANANGRVEVGAISHPGEPNAPAFSGAGLVGSIKFRLLQGGSTTVSVDFSPGGTADSNMIGRSGEILARVTNMTLTVNSPITPIDTPTPTPVPSNTPVPTGVPTDTPTPTPTVDPSTTPVPTVTIDPSITPSVTPIVTTNPSVTPSTTGTSGSMNLNLKVRLQGIRTQPKTTATVPLEVTITGGSLAAPVVKTMQATADATGVYSGTLAYTEIPAGTGYKIYVKGPKHLKKKICTVKPTENATGTYKCIVGSLSFGTGENFYDFSGVSLIGGDLPDATGKQDGVIDRNDLIFVINNLSSTDPTVLARGDINFDGVINAQDYSFMLEALSFRLDEE